MIGHSRDLKKFTEFNLCITYTFCNVNFNKVGSLTDRNYFWKQWMGGWVTHGDVFDNSHVDDAGDTMMLGLVFLIRKQKEILIVEPTAQYLCHGLANVF